MPEELIEVGASFDDVECHGNFGHFFDLSIRSFPDVFRPRLIIGLQDFSCFVQHCPVNYDTIFPVWPIRYFS